MILNNSTINVTANSEAERLHSLYSYDILDTEAEQEFDNLTQLAASICGTPVSMINLIDKSRQWSKSVFSDVYQSHEIPRENSVCTHTIEQSGPLEIINLAQDSHFKHLPSVINSPKFRYYLGAPIVDNKGNTLGALCVLDYKQRELSEMQKRQLQIVANEVMARLELKNKNRELKKINKHKIELMKILSHDMRSPLSGIIGISGLLSESIDTGKEEKEMLEIIEQSALQLNHMIDEILNYSLIESQGFSLQKKQTDIDSIVEKMRRLYEPAACNKGISVTIINENIDSAVSVDKEKFEQILGNLLSNAVKFTKKGGDVMAKLRLDSENGGNFLKLSVQDTGIGMSKKALSSLFVNDIDPAEEGTSGEKNSGIGLHIIKNFVDLHEGEINVESETGSGTKFTIHIPLSLN